MFGAMKPVSLLFDQPTLYTTIQKLTIVQVVTEIIYRSIFIMEQLRRPVIQFIQLAEKVEFLCKRHFIDIHLFYHVTSLFLQF